LVAALAAIVAGLLPRRGRRKQILDDPGTPPDGQAQP
jgi:hypothetical protein